MSKPFWIADLKVFASDAESSPTEAVRRHQQRRKDEANFADRTAWSTDQDRETWEALRNPGIEALRRSLGEFPQPTPLNPAATVSVEGAGYRIENLVFEKNPILLPLESQVWWYGDQRRQKAQAARR